MIYPNQCGHIKCVYIQYLLKISWSMGITAFRFHFSFLHRYTARHYRWTMDILLAWNCVGMRIHIVMGIDSDTHLYYRILYIESEWRCTWGIASERKWREISACGLLHRRHSTCYCCWECVWNLRNPKNKPRRSSQYARQWQCRRR